MVTAVYAVRKNDTVVVIAGRDRGKRALLVVRG